MNQFEIVSSYESAEVALPTRATKLSAGYDLAAAKDILIPPYEGIMRGAKYLYEQEADRYILSLADMAQLSDQTGRPTLVPTGLKCQLDSDKYLELVARSSLPYKHWLILANGVGIIDSDYYNNSDNEGEIFVQLINLSPAYIAIRKGDKIAQGIIRSYIITENDQFNSQIRAGGFGSTSG